LAADIRPVKRLRPPGRRAGLWLVAVAVVAAATIASFADFTIFLRRAQDPWLVSEVAATLATGIAAVIAAFQVSLPDRTHAWLLLPLPPLLLWLASSSMGCYHHWLTVGSNCWALGESANCFRFIVTTSVPLGLALFVVLRRAAPLAPVPAAMMGGLGVAAIAAFVLQFFHPFDVTIVDLAVHVAAVALVVLIASTAPGAARLLGRASAL
jgi:hypothetical protein